MAASTKESNSLVVSYSHWDASKTHWDDGEAVWDVVFRPPPISPPGADYRPPNTSVRSWAQIVRDADKDFDLESRRPVVYEFSNGRKFRQKPDPYATAPGDSTSPGYPGGAKA